jgi:transcriptional regulator with XRE-family HTH domain
MAVAKTLKSWRVKNGLKQRDVAEQLGVQASFIAFIESGRRQPSLPLLIKLADLMKVDRIQFCRDARPDLAELLDDRPPRHRASQPVNIGILRTAHATEAEIEVLKAVQRLGRIRRPRDLLFVLNAIRQALD